MLKRIINFFDRDQAYADQLQREDEAYKVEYEVSIIEREYVIYRRNIERTMINYLKRSSNEDKVKIWQKLSIDGYLSDEFRTNNFKDDDDNYMV